ncbi:hypothetical protein DASB73_015940 [Starmerella bacillaris]|uniref:Uncharacterized protein n=1 Tax=Starmerella bacillaris TaxID=1247836 RepID=A0AAV5RJ41_STABA|nr:hypothetical protein DASB73_015940 [Starmerella bacillaris]
MDESWDAEFDGELRVPDSVRSVSESVRAETQAARTLAQTISRIRSKLMTIHPSSSDSVLTNAVSLVHASLESTKDDFYSCEAWKVCGNSGLEVDGSSIEDVLQQAAKVEQELSAY